MPSFKPTDIWDAEPHTLAKLEIIERYLYLWFSILGRTRQSLAYIDGFAGPGKYRNTPRSSPVAALKAAEAAMHDAGSAFKAQRIAFRFIETKFAKILQDVIQETKWPPIFDIKISETEFELFMDDALTKLRARSSDIPIFAFVDPFGPTPVPFRVVEGLLQFHGSEVLLNLDSDGIDRLAGAATNPQNQAHLSRIFGNESWRTELNPALSKGQRWLNVLALYKQRLRSVPTVRYVFAFAMNSKQGVLNYHLVFASQHRVGLEKMKEAMKAVDQDGNFSFSDDSVGQPALFRTDDANTFAAKLRNALAGTHRPYSDFDDFALNETPFLNPKALLKVLTEQGALDVKWKGQPSKTGFPAEKIESILIRP
jgi:three-Cys-motif partner protein